ncbi:hypothetical protein Ahy_B06g080740 [Arachis hypogaea]|uniref:Uncharacterized protein n=1 Tax=Arachis hypogaea TaxID=3818 RepID=A0A444YJ05_ARAHY|nr:hypothetical protein Ahy_B06g080740 [Arachis hypogaea]
MFVASVLIKPYREKSKVIEKYFLELFQETYHINFNLVAGSMLVEFSTLYYSSHHIDMDSEMNSIPRSCGNARSLKRQLMEEQEQALELVEIQKRCLAALQFAQNFLSTSPHFRFSINGMRASEGML